MLAFDQPLAPGLDRSINFLSQLWLRVTHACPTRPRCTLRRGLLIRAISIRRSRSIIEIRSIIKRAPETNPRVWQSRVFGRQPTCVRQCRRVRQIVRLIRRAFGALRANRSLPQQLPRINIALPQRTRVRLRFPQADRKGPRSHYRSLCPRRLIDALCSRAFIVCLNDTRLRRRNAQPSHHQCHEKLLGAHRS